MTKKLLTLTLCLLATSAFGATRTAANLTRSEVNGCINGGTGTFCGLTNPAAMNDGDVLNLPATQLTTGGTFTLTVGGSTTAALSHNTTAAAIKTALEGLGTVGNGNVEVTAANNATIGSQTFAWEVHFQNAKGLQPITMTATASSITPAALNRVTATSIVLGTATKDQRHLVTIGNCWTIADGAINITKNVVIQGAGIYDSGSKSTIPLGVKAFDVKTTTGNDFTFRVTGVQFLLIHDSANANANPEVIVLGGRSRVHYDGSGNVKGGFRIDHNRFTPSSFNTTYAMCTRSTDWVTGVI
jgi:hypothetical protein